MANITYVEILTIPLGFYKMLSLAPGSDITYALPRLSSLLPIPPILRDHSRCLIGLLSKK